MREFLGSVCGALKFLESRLGTYSFVDGRIVFEKEEDARTYDSLRKDIQAKAKQVTDWEAARRNRAIDKLQSLQVPGG
jgi:hypothetical protein